MKTLIVPKKYNNKKLISFLLDSFTGITSSTIYKALRKKDIKINDTRISQNCLLQTGDEIKIYIADNLLIKTLDIPIIYQDENIIIFNKPVGLEVTGQNSLHEYGKEILSNSTNTFIEPCHRLDRNTSGLVIFARNESSLNILLDAFKLHLIEKHYLCIVNGVPKIPQQKLEAFLFKDSKKSLVYISNTQKPGYQKIITYYKVLEHNKNTNTSLLDIKLETGKTHQIRAHLAYIGHPIIGDGKYGINTINKKFKITTQLLASYSLSFNLPTTCKLNYLNHEIIKLPNIPFNNFYKKYN